MPVSRSVLAGQYEADMDTRIAEEQRAVWCLGDESYNVQKGAVTLVLLVGRQERAMVEQSL